jgi:hypothetical protein
MVEKGKVLQYILSLLEDTTVFLIEKYSHFEDASEVSDLSSFRGICGHLNGLNSKL